MVDLLDDLVEEAAEAMAAGPDDRVSVAATPDAASAVEPPPVSVPPQDDEEPWDEDVPLLSPEGEIVDLAAPAPRVGAKPPRTPAPAPTPPPSRTMLERLQSHGPTQLGAALMLGAVVFGGLQLAKTPEPEAISDPVVGRSFPKIDVEGFEEPLTSGDVRRLLERSAAREAASKPPVPPPTRVEPAALVRARPGELYRDTGEVGVVVGTPEDRARVLRREAARASRRTAPPPAETPKRRVLGPEFFQPGGTLEVKETAPARQRPSLDIQVGTVLDATLVMGVSSLAPGVVLARVTRSVRTRGRTAVHKGATLRGRARAQQDRLFLTFHSLEQRGETFRFEGFGADKSMPGVVAIVHEASLESRGRSGAGRSAVGTAGSVIGELVGQTLPGRVARSVAEGVASEAQQDLQPDRSRVLELPVGCQFQIVVAGGGA